MDIGSIALILVLGILLAASTGLRAFLGPFALGCAQRFGWVHMANGLDFLGDGLVIGALAVGIIVEVLSDKIPAVHHALDVLHLGFKPLAGALVGTAMLSEASPLLAWVAAIVAGGAVAGVTHVTKAGLRVGSSAVTVGAAAPVHSLAEDGVALVLVAAGLGGMWISG